MQEKLPRQEKLPTRQSEEQAVAGWIARMMPTIRACAVRSVCPGLDYDDAVQEGLIALFHALQTYDETRGASFSTYAGVCIQNAVCSAARAAQRNKHAPLNNSVPLEDLHAAPGPEELVLESERYEDAVQSIATRLSALERQVLALFLDGCSYNAISRQLGVSEKTVDNALQRVRGKLR